MKENKEELVEVHPNGMKTVHNMKERPLKKVEANTKPRSSPGIAFYGVPVKYHKPARD